MRQIKHFSEGGPQTPPTRSPEGLRPPSTEAATAPALTDPAAGGEARAPRPLPRCSMAPKARNETRTQQPIGALGRPARQRPCQRAAAADRAGPPPPEPGP
ncbi:hypothetical protein GCM10009575_007740 [Streptomyces rhizosphaericus]|uniref:Uncharacterized protein n=1 Tax=Streptomyces rhizosphaericus TaxID=114699 RepID=A0ABP3Z906_9ACTN